MEKMFSVFSIFTFFFPPTTYFLFPPPPLSRGSHAEYTPLYLLKLFNFSLVLHYDLSKDFKKKTNKSRDFFRVRHCFSKHNMVGLAEK